MKKKTNRKEFPSQKTYRENNPSITFRLKKEDKEKLDSIIEASGKHLSRWMTDFIHNEMDPNGEISDLVKRKTFLEDQMHALEDIITELENEEKFCIPCSICGKPLFLSSKHAKWTTRISPKLKETFSKWCHAECKSSKSPSPIKVSH